MLVGRPGALVFAIVAMMVAPSILCFGSGAVLTVPLALHAIALARAGLTGERPPLRVWHLVLALFPALVPASATVVLFGASGWVDDGWGRVLAVSIAAATTGALLSFVTGTSHHAIGGERFGTAMERALGDAVRAGLGARALAGAVIALVTTALPFAILILWATNDDRAFRASIGVPIGQGLALVWLVALGVPVGETATGRGAVRLRSIAALGAPVVAMVLAALAFAAARPSAPRSAPTADEVDRSESFDERVELAGVHGLVVRRLPRGVSIETADGGGAGPQDFGVIVPPYGDPDGDLRVSGSAEHGWIVYAATVFGTWPFEDRVWQRRGVRFDARGVRTDDGIVDRVRGRFHQLGLGLLLASFLFSLPFFVVLARGLGSAAILGRGESRGEWTAWRGSLEVERGLGVSGDRVETGEGRVVLDGGDAIVHVGPGTPVIGDGGALLRGMAVTVVGRAATLAPLGPRSGAVAWPEGAWLVVGSLDAARERIARRTLGTAALLGVPAALLAIGACLASLAS